MAEGPESLLDQEEAPFPDDVQGTCIIMGTEGAGDPEEPIALDRAHAIYQAVARTRAMGRKDVRTRVEVVTAFPRRLIEAKGDINAVFNSTGPYALFDMNNPETHALRVIETRSAVIARAIAGEARLDDVDVVTLSERLGEQKGRRSWIRDLAAAEGNFGKLLRLQRVGNGKTQDVVLKQILCDLAPDWLKTTSEGEPLPPEEIEKLIYYPLVELIRIIQKVEGKIGLFHYLREEINPQAPGGFGFIPLAQAYMQQILQQNDLSLSVRDYVRMPEAVEGLRLPAANARDNIPLKLCESYRVHPRDLERRVLIYPHSDTVAAMTHKLQAVPEKARDAYFLQMIIPMIRLFYEFIAMVGSIRSRIDIALGEVNLANPQNTEAEREKLLGVLFDFVIAPLAQGIGQKLKEAEREGSGVVGAPVNGHGGEGSGRTRAK